MGQENILTLIRKFSIPDIISSLVSAAYNIVDQIFIGRGVGDYDALRRALSLCIYWAPHNKLEEGLDIGETFLSCVWEILYPSEGKRQYQALAQTF